MQLIFNFLRLMWGWFFVVIAFIFGCLTLLAIVEGEGFGVIFGVFLFFYIPAHISYRIFKTYYKRKKNLAYWQSATGKKQILYEVLTDISGVSDKIARTLLDQFPTIESVQLASIEDLSDIPGVGKSIAKAIKARIG